MRERRTQSRRRFLAAAGVASTTALAGCSGISGLLGGNGSDDDGDKPTLADFRGSGEYVADRSAPGGTSIEDLPDLEGNLSIYLGGGEGGRYVNLIDLLDRYYPEFNPTHQTQSSAQLANNIVDEYETGTTQADVFWSVDAGSLAYVAENDASTSLSFDTTVDVPADFRTDEWVGVAGRARAIPYNTDQYSESDIPTSVDAFAQQDRFAGTLGWAPTYGAFHGFVTAMRQLRDEDGTRQWLNGVLDQNPARFDSEYLVVSDGIANGEIGAGFSNHYYAILVLASRSDAPVDLAFTENDAGALVNVSGASVLSGASNPDLAQNFVRHLLSAEAQEFVATRGFAYPMLPNVAPVGPLPTIDELNPPDLDLQALSDVQPTLQLLRDVGILS